jgi:hypothetical protein
MTRVISSVIEFLPKEAWGALSLTIGAVAYAVYIHDTISDDDVQPHPLSWLAWTFATFMAALVQSNKQAGSGAWVTWFTSGSCATVLFFAIWKQQRKSKAIGEKRHLNSWWDWGSLGLSVSAAILFGSMHLFNWAQGANITAALATFADVVAYKPTISKGWTHPYTDNPWAFLLNAVKFAPALAALKQTSLATVLFPVTLIFFNSGVFSMLLWRRCRKRSSCAGPVGV